MTKSTTSKYVRPSRSKAAIAARLAAQEAAAVANPEVGEGKKTAKARVKARASATSTKSAFPKDLGGAGTGNPITKAELAQVRAQFAEHGFKNLSAADRLHVRVTPWGALQIHPCTDSRQPKIAGTPDYFVLAKSVVDLKTGVFGYDVAKADYNDMLISLRVVPREDLERARLAIRAVENDLALANDKVNGLTTANVLLNPESTELQTKVGHAEAVTKEAVADLTRANSRVASLEAEATENASPVSINMWASCALRNHPSRRTRIPSSLSPRS